MGRFEKLMRWMNVFAIFATFLAYLSPYVSPVRFWQFSFFGLIYPWLLLTNLLFVFFWILRKQKYFLLSLGCILLGWTHVTSFVGFNFFGEIKAEESITVGSYNIRNLSSLVIGLKTEEEKEKKRNEFIHFLKRENELQILCTQETSNYNYKLLKEKFNFPFSHQMRTAGTAIFSKYPIFNSGRIDFGTTTNSCIWADITIGEKKVRIYSIHFQSNQVSGIADKVVKKGDFRERETFNDIRGMMSRFRLFARRRAEQARLVANHIATCPHSIIVCGDFNDTPQSYTYHLLTQKLNDTFKEKGKGFGTTYAGNIPALRIDYILTSERIKVQSHEILKGNFSDHYPVICKISLEK